MDDGLYTAWGQGAPIILLWCPRPLWNCSACGLAPSVSTQSVSTAEGPPALENLWARLWLCGRHFECTDAENAARKSSAYSGLWQVFYIRPTVYASSTIKKNYVRTFKGRHFDRQGFLYYSCRAFGARKLCLHVWGSATAQHQPTMHQHMRRFFAGNKPIYIYINL